MVTVPPLGMVPRLQSISWLLPVWISTSWHDPWLDVIELVITTARFCLGSVSVRTTLLAASPVLLTVMV